jgi:hypothetical protein
LFELLINSATNLSKSTIEPERSAVFFLVIMFWCEKLRVLGAKVFER